MDALELLKQDHAKVKELFEEAESADQNEQKTIFKQIKTELEVHAHIEESVFYPAMQKFNELKEMVRESVEEHNKVKTLLKEMDTLSGGEDFEDRLEELIDNVEHHAEEEEEGKMFPKVRELVSSTELEKLGNQLQAAKGQRKAS
ncbi:MAG: hemerythrin domain-containing protein [Deltaproteobacteria bacterium]|nr:hemerythrin domain-containing protein [Deltaproteobacteria bacterium]